MEKHGRPISRRSRGWIELLARFGYAAKGVVYLTIGLLAALAALGRGGQTTDSKGALETLLRQPFGRVLLAVVAAGLAAYALWRFVQAVADAEREGSDAGGLGRRAVYGIGGLVYTSLALTAAGMVMSGGGGGDGEAASRAWTARLLAKPFGQGLVAGAGLAILAFAAYQFHQAYTAHFREELKEREMSPRARTVALRTGRLGLAARGVVFTIVGLFLMAAALHADAGEAKGLGGALRTLEAQPFGPWILGVVALGLAAYGAYMFVQARYRRIEV